MILLVFISLFLSLCSLFIPKVVMIFNSLFITFNKAISDIAIVRVKR